MVNKNNFFSCLVEILEERPTFEIPRIVTQSVFILSYVQIAVYLFSGIGEKIITSPILQSIFNIMQFSSLSQVLAYQSSDILSYSIAIASFIFYLTVIIYIGVYTVIKNHYTSEFKAIRSTVTNINAFLHLVFCFFLPVIANYSTEVFAGLLFCSPRSIITRMRESYYYHRDCQSINVLAIPGLILIAIFMLINVSLFKNIAYREDNVMKRKITSLLVFSQLMKFIITLIEHSSINSNVMRGFKHVMFHAFGLASVYDMATFSNGSLSDPKTARFNLSAACGFYSLVVVCNIWSFFKYVDESEIFYLTIILGTVLVSVFKVFFDSRLEQMFEVNIFHRIQQDDQSDGVFPIDLYLETWMQLAEVSQVDKKALYYCSKIFALHCKTCLITVCPCKISQSINNSNEKLESVIFSKKKSGRATAAAAIATAEAAASAMNSEMLKQRAETTQIKLIVNEIFRWSLRQKNFMNNSRFHERLVLKYVSFIQRSLNNPVLASFELNRTLFRQQSASSSSSNSQKPTASHYFQLLSRVLSDELEEQIRILNKPSLSMEGTQSRKEELRIEHISMSDLLCEEFMPLCSEVVRKKINLWKKMQIGFSHIGNFRLEVLGLSYTIDALKTRFHNRIDTLKKHIELQYCLPVKKLQQIFSLLVLNDSKRAIDLDTEMIELRKRDSFIDDDFLKNENIISKNIISLILSLAGSLGKIVSSKDTKTAEFFGYSSQNEFARVQYLNEILPQYVSKDHDAKLMRFIQRGKSKYLKNPIQSFARNQQGFIMPVKVHLNFAFESLAKDFLMQATILKTDKSSDFVLFDRSGKIFGLSQRLSNMLLIESKIVSKLPTAENLIKSLNAFTLFPRIVKKLVGRKKEIDEGSEIYDSEILFTSDQGKIYFDTTLLNQTRTFTVFLNKTANLTSTNYSSIVFKPESDKSSQSLNQNSNSGHFDKLDVFSKDSYLKYNAFNKAHKQAFQEGNLSAAELLHGTTDKSVTTVDSSRRSTSSNISKKLRISFSYQLSFQINYTSINALSTAANGNSADIEDLRCQKQMIFVLKMRDLKLENSLDPPQKITSKLTLFATRIVAALRSLTAIHALQRYIDPNGSSISRHTPKIPQHLLSLIFEKSTATINSGSSKTLKQQMKNITGTIKNNSFKTQKKGQSKKNARDPFRDESEFLSDSSQHSTVYSDSESDYENDEIDVPRIVKYVKEQYEQQDINTIDAFTDLLNFYSISMQDLSKNDRLVIARKVVVSKSSSSFFIQALELNIADSLLALNSHELKDTFDPYNTITPDITFRADTTTERPETFTGRPQTGRPEIHVFDSDSFNAISRQQSSYRLFQSTNLLNNQNVSAYEEENQKTALSRLQMDTSNIQNEQMTTIVRDLSTNNPFRELDPEKSQKLLQKQPKHSMKLQGSKRGLKGTRGIDELSSQLQNRNLSQRTQINKRQIANTTSRSKSLDLKKKLNTEEEQKAALGEKQLNNFFNNSNEVSTFQQGTIKSKASHIQAVANILQQSGIIDSKALENVSVNSSSRSASSSGGYFLKGNTNSG